MARSFAKLVPFPDHLWRFGSLLADLADRWLPRRSRLMLAGVPALALGIVVVWHEPQVDGPVAPARTGERVGKALVLDGDTLQIGRTRIRLHAIDAPEPTQNCHLSDGTWACGRAAATYLRHLTAGRTVTCEDFGTDRDGRMLGFCRAEDLDIGSQMVRAGLAMAYRDYSWTYFPEELAARITGEGIWATDFDAPWDWRRKR